MPLNSILEGLAQVSVSRALLPSGVVEATEDNVALDASQNCTSKTQNPTEQDTCLKSTKQSKIHALTPPQDLGQAHMWTKGILWFFKNWTQLVLSILPNCNPVKIVNLPKRNSHPTDLLDQSFHWHSLSQFPALQDCSEAGGGCSRVMGKTQSP